MRKIQAEKDRKRDVQRRADKEEKERMISLIYIYHASFNYV